MAFDLATNIMRHACGANPERFDAWSHKAVDGIDHYEPYSTVLRAVISGLIGIPGEEKPVDQLEGLIAEHIWYNLTSEQPEPGTLRIDGPSLQVTEQGADALVVFVDDQGDFSFRLWEIEKHRGTKLSRTINRGYTQLNENATRYLAKYSLIGATMADAELGAFFGRMAEAWVDATSESAAGVCVVVRARDDESTPTGFSTFGSHFPKLADGQRLRGALGTVGEFALFCEEVRAAIWKGL